MASYLFPYLFGEKRNEKDYIPPVVKSKAKFAGVSYEKERPQSLDGYGDYLSQYSNDDVAVYGLGEGPVKSKYNISIRGTDLNNFNRAMKDIPADARLGASMYETDPRYYHAYRTVQTLKNLQKHQGFEPQIDVYGHSLGGGISDLVSRNVHGVKSYAFNAAIFSPEDNPNNTSFRMKGDPVSIKDGTKTKFEFNSQALDKHGIDNFY